MKAALVCALLAATVALVVAFAPRVAHAQLLSPGPLAKAHSSLEGDQHCNDCHSSGKRVDQGACLKCHGDVGARIAAGKGLHGLQYKGKPCEGCHADHLGGDAPVRWPGGDPSKLDHALTGWPLTGAHQKPSCTKCHDKKNARGNHTYLELSTSCGSCHKDVHENRFGPTCTNCHDEVAWKDLKLDGFNHDLAKFPLHGAHQTTPCAKCHFDPPKYTGLKFLLCTDCHKDVHQGKLGPSCTTCHDEVKWKPVTFKPGTHPGTSLANGHASVSCRTCHDRGNLVAPSKGSECVSCHAPVHKAPFGRGCATCHGSIQWLDLPRAIGLAAHVKTVYPLEGKHEAVVCANCHKPTMAREARYRKLAFGRCIDCHEDKHRGEFAKANRGECTPCHGTFGFRPTLFSVAAHAATRFALEGAHTASACSSCHKGQRPLFDLRVAKQTCADCHANPHGDQFKKEMGAGGCAHCHNAVGWDLPKIDHSTWPLTGAHATAKCDSCHHPTAEDRKAGQGASYRGIPRNCGGCHDDLHLGQFRLSRPVLECDKCHATDVFKVARFDHQAIANWPLTGAHAKVECAKCHPMATLGNARRTVRWRLPESDCKFCHANPHRPVQHPGPLAALPPGEQQGVP
jgi:hypothetical protein